MKRWLIVLVAVGCVSVSVPRAQMHVVPVDEQQGHVALGLALRHLNNTGIFMMATAHPDDEDNGLLVMLNRGLGYRTALATATRGNGGQNEIGPEIFEALGVLRTEELAAIHRFDGAEQYFTRAVDFGFSFSVDETFEKWGKDEITGDFVRLIRTIRPDVITGLTPGGDGGGQHHQASALIAREAFKAAGDPTRYPDQIAAGLRPWQPKKFYYSAQVGNGRDAPPDPKLTTLNVSGYDRLLGKTYAEIGTEARSMHKCQGMAQLLALPGPVNAAYQLIENNVPGPAQRADTALFDGIDTTLTGLTRFAGQRPPKELTEGLAGIAAAVANAQRRFDTENDDAVLLPLLTGVHAVRVLRAQLRMMAIDEVGRYEIDYRLRQKEREFQQAILLAGAVRFEALADDGVVVAGQPVRVSVLVANRGAADVTVKQVKLDGFDGNGACALTAVLGGGGRGNAPVAGPPVSILKRGQVGQCAPTVNIPAGAVVSEPYWHRAGEAGRYTFDDDAPFGLPYRPTPFYVQATLSFAGGEDVFGGVPVQYRSEGDIFSGEKRADLLIVPSFSVRVSPEVAIVPTPTVPPPPTAVTPPTRGAAPGARPAAPARGRGAATSAPPPAPTPVAAAREVRVTVKNDTKGQVDAVARVQAPQGWTVAPAEQPVKFSREDEVMTVRFQVTPSATTRPGEFHLKATVSAGGADASRGYQVIDYPHIRRQHLYREADVMVKVIDVKTAPNLTLGYIMGVGDDVPRAIEQLGVKVEMIGPDDLAWGNLSRFSTIVMGVRAYERRADLRANNSRLIDYVRDGGTLVVQYNKFEFNQAQYGPFPAEVSADRVTDEAAPVKVLAADHPVLNAPNKLSDAIWANWVQERGLYFLGEHDSRYRDLVAIEDSFPNNTGEKRGALVAAQFGKGRWVYVGLGLWRELPAGVDGAYQLLANLISLGHT